MSITAGLSLAGGFLKGNWSWLLGAAGCAVLGGLLIWERYDHAHTSADLARTETTLVARTAQYQAAEEGRQTLKTSLGTVQTALVVAQEQAREAQALVGVAIQRGSVRSQDLRQELDRLRQAAPAEGQSDAEAAEALGREIWE